jgi:hypothetical protein
MQINLLNKRKGKASGRKLLLAGLAILLGIAILASGSLAYQNFQQTALNPFEGFVANGTRLHDDYKGVINEKQNPKHVYVENFGKTSLLVRIRFSEYFELGGDKLLGTDKSDTSTWVVRRPNILNATSADWGWTMGGQKYYLPTDNTDDIINNVPTGSDASKPENIIGRSWYDAVTGTDLETKNYASTMVGALGTGVTVDPFTAADAGTVFTDNVFEDDTTTPSTYGQKTVKQTASSTVLTMDEWIAAGKQQGPYWVSDTDGWYYWADYLEPGNATGLLLKQVDMLRGMVKDYYYGINVEMQSATWNEVYKFGTDGNVISDAARDLLHYAANTFAYDITPTVQSIGKVFEDASGVKWRVLDVNPYTMQALILRDHVRGQGNDQWHTSEMVFSYAEASLTTMMNSGAYYTGLDATLKSQLPATAKTIKVCQMMDNTTVNWSAGKVFLLGQYDVFGTPGRAAEATTVTSDGWLKGAPYFAQDAERIALNDAGKMANAWWLRSANQNPVVLSAAPDVGGIFEILDESPPYLAGVASVAPDGTLTSGIPNTTPNVGTRDAMFINIKAAMIFPNLPTTP